MQHSVPPPNGTDPKSEIRKTDHLVLSARQKFQHFTQTDKVCLAPTRETTRQKKKKFLRQTAGFNLCKAQTTMTNCCQWRIHKSYRHFLWNTKGVWKREKDSLKATKHFRSRFVHEKEKTCTEAFAFWCPNTLPKLTFFLRCFFENREVDSCWSVIINQTIMKLALCRSSLSFWELYKEQSGIEYVKFMGNKPDWSGKNRFCVLKRSLSPWIVQTPWESELRF